MPLVQFPQESWSVAINPAHVVLVSPLTDRRSHDPREFSRVTTVPGQSIITLSSPLKEGGFWIVVDSPFEDTIAKLQGAGI